MELSVEGLTGIKIEGNASIRIPPYMKVLRPEEFVVVSRYDKRETLIIAAGKEPSSGDLVLITGSGNVCEIKANDVLLPQGFARPGHFGLTVEFDNIDVVEMSNDWLLSRAKVIASLSNEYVSA